ncbi:CitMHS family citrate-Mg2+:H+ or citrate-Ca2+:H+ symporter [Anaerospora hongkongensis]|uniref:CitMHS family citrate-Mg2+:H+ or citrate-Ca2+:H+ symporter n=1 Tax=Anaerospora hongkongensis TaxID=244830 RepID=A0A4R1Q5L3_9FIRM|nr:citrate:proton symporter [Anaerospora hongkongensis]TCL39846.1 CitMHS family citrate-Mg2+:H+ or citrate-Ca2+:H+ symporter [Anaerospora hongkongensis]
MIAFAGFLLVIVFMTLLMKKKLSAMVGLILLPILFAIVLGFGPNIGDMALAGIKQVAPTAVMIAFAMIYFLIMIDTGLFDPLINAILKATKGDPVRVVVGTALLAGLVSLDGDGATTYIITTSAMLAVHRKLKIDPVILPTLAIMQNGVMNITPWGGPTARVMAALNLDASQLFTPLIPGMFIGTAWILFVAYRFGIAERKRLGVLNPVCTETAAVSEFTVELDEGAAALKRPKMFWINLTLTVILMVCLVGGFLPLNVLFMVGTAITLLINYPNLKVQAERISYYGTNVLPNISMVLGAGIFTGIMSGTKMIDAMAKTLTNNIPESMGPHLALITGLTSLPFDYFLTMMLTILG